MLGNVGGPLQWNLVRVVMTLRKVQGEVLSPFSSWCSLEWWGGVAGKR